MFVWIDHCLVVRGMLGMNGWFGKRICCSWDQGANW